MWGGQLARESLLLYPLNREENLYALPVRKQLVAFEAVSSMPVSVCRVCGCVCVVLLARWV